MNMFLIYILPLTAFFVTPFLIYLSSKFALNRLKIGKDTHRKYLAIISTFILVVGTLFTFLYIVLDENPQYVDGIYVGYEALNASYVGYGHINYPKLLRKALRKDYASIRKMALLYSETSASNFMVHGSALIGLIERIGEDEFIRAVGSVDKKQQETLWSTICGGMDYNSSFGSKKAKEAFPKIYALTENSRRGRDNIFNVIWQGRMDLRQIYVERLFETPHLKGRIMLELEFDEFCVMTSAKILSSTTGDSEFDSIIATTVRGWEFEKTDKPCSMSGTATYLDFPDAKTPRYLVW